LASLPVAALIYTRIRNGGADRPGQRRGISDPDPIAVVADGLRRWKRHADEGRARLSALEREQAEALRRAAEQNGPASHVSCTTW
jgi:hypothetical protein